MEFYIINREKGEQETTINPHWMVWYRGYKNENENENECENKIKIITVIIIIMGKHLFCIW